MSAAHGRRFVGVVLLALGILLLLDRVGDIAGLIEIVHVWWPVGLAGLAAANLATFLRRPRLAPSPVRWSLLASAGLLLVAGVILLGTTGIVRLGVAKYVLPTLLIIAGLLLTLWEGNWDRQHQQSVSVTAILRRKFLRIKSKNIHYIRVRALLGDVQLDLSESELTRATEVHATVWRGRILLHCDPSWPIEIKDPVGQGIDIQDPRPPNSRYSGQPGKLLSVYTMGGHGVVVLTLSA